MKALPDILEINSIGIDLLSKQDLDGYIARHLYGYIAIEKSLLGGYWMGRVPTGGTETRLYPVPECTVNANSTFDAVNKAISGIGFGNIFIEFWNDGEWYVTNRPSGHRLGVVEARCDGNKPGGKPDIKLAVCRFLVKMIRVAVEETGNVG